MTDVHTDVHTYVYNDTYVHTSLNDGFRCPRPLRHCRWQRTRTVSALQVKRGAAGAAGRQREAVLHAHMRCRPVPGFHVSPGAKPNGLILSHVCHGVMGVMSTATRVLGWGWGGGGMSLGIFTLGLGVAGGASRNDTTSGRAVRAIYLNQIV